MKKYLFFLVALVVGAVSCSERTENVICVDVPERPAGQESVVGLAADPIETVRIGVIGLGMRGASAVDRLTYVPDAKVTALCDLQAENVSRLAACRRATQRSQKRDSLDLGCSTWSENQ